MTRLLNSILTILHLLSSPGRHTQGAVNQQHNAEDSNAQLQLIHTALKQIHTDSEADRILKNEMDRKRLCIELWTLAFVAVGVVGAWGNLWFLKATVDTSKLAMIASERAYVHNSGFRFFSHPDPQGQTFWRIRPRWSNIGNTPTRDLRLDTHYELRDSELPLDYPFVPGELVPGTIHPKETVEPIFYNISGTDLLAVMQAKKYLYIWGTARYRDMFPGNKEHVTKFLVVASNITGNPLLPYSDPGNLFNIEFMHDPRHDCADEDCDRQEQAGSQPAKPKPK
jgi:hypothetical protein